MLKPEKTFSIKNITRHWIEVKIFIDKLNRHLQAHVQVYNAIKENLLQQEVSFN